MSNSLSIHFHTKIFYVHMFDIVDIAFRKRIDRLLITSGIFQVKRKYSVCDLKCRCCVFTLSGRPGSQYIAFARHPLTVITVLIAAA